MRRSLFLTALALFAAGAAFVLIPRGETGVELPNAAEWAAQRDEVAALHHQGMYWLLAHAILGNEAELTDCIARARSNPSRLVQVLADAMEADPTAGGRFETERAKVFELVRQAL